jgi:signal peptidase I
LENFALTETPQRRLPWLAALLSLLTPGLGQLYSGRPKRAVAWFLVAAVAGGAFYGARALGLIAENPGILPAVYALLVAIWIGAIVDAWRVAAQAGSIALAWYNRWYLYLAIMLLSGLAGLAVPTPSAQTQPFSMPSGSMIPTLVVGDIFQVQTDAYRSAPPQPGDVVVVTKEAGGRSFVKRVIGVAGDRVQMKEGRLYINGAMVERKDEGPFTDPDNGTGTATLTQYEEILPNGRRYRIVELSDKEFFDNTPEFLVPPGELFLLGDNRDSSMDSRAIGEFGFIPLGHVLGRVLFISGSLDPTRIGMKID